MIRQLFLILLLTAAGLVSADILSEPPAEPSADAHYLFYLHGGIVEGSDGRPVSEQYGPYEYQLILEAFETAGFVVISEIRPARTDTESYAGQVVGWIDQLMAKGVPVENISVVGASKGGMIATHVSSRLANPQLRFVFVAGLFERLAANDSVRIAGGILSVHDASDVNSIDASAFIGGNGLVSESKVLITDTGLGHGLLYTPHPLWIEPAIEWALRR